MADIDKIDAFVQSSPHPAWLATSEGVCLYANPALERLIGLNSDQINQADWLSFVLEDDRAAAAASWQRSLASGTPYRTRVRMQGFDGVPAPVELIAFGHKPNDGPELWLFSGLHVHGATQQCPRLDAQLQATLNVIPAYTWYALPSGALTFVNERTADYLGLPRDHPLRLGIDTGAGWDSHIPLLHPDDHDLLVGKLHSLSYSRDVESRADLTGSDVCAGAGYNPWGLVWLFRDLDNANLSQVPQLISDHPSNQNRVEALERHFRASLGVGKVQLGPKVGHALLCSQERARSLPALGMTVSWGSTSESCVTTTL